MSTPLEDEEFAVFLEEAKEDVASLEQHVLTLESQGASLDDAVVNTMFRAVHTIKGNAGFFNVKPITELTHVMENALGLLRNHQLTCGHELASALLDGTDLLARMLKDVEHLEDFDRGLVIERLTRLAVPASAPRTSAASATGTPKDAAPAPPAPAVPDRPSPALPVGLAVPMEGPIASPPAAKAATPTAPQAAKEHAGAKDHGGPSRDAEAAGTVRVKLTQLDRLMRLAGELVLTRNALLKKAADRDLTAMTTLTQQVDAITSELQDGVMATRMQPVGVVFTKFRRVVRDLSAILGKQIELAIEGDDVELDKTLIEAIGGPLTHLVRNAADHGIESPSKRGDDGKPEHGTIALRAFHQAGQVVIEVSDDGAGIDGDRVAAKALEKKLITADQIQAMSSEERVRLIFLPGLSTASSITQVSGRGVGMDVVLNDLTKVGGTVDIRSEMKRGTTITVRLPLTLAIIPSILVRVNEQRFAVPQVNLLELVRIPPGEVQRKVERVGSAEVMRLRDQLLPLVRLSDVLGMEHLYHDPSTGEPLRDRRKQGFDRRSPVVDEPVTVPANRRSGLERRRSPESTVYVAVLAAGSIRYGLIVDQLLDSEEIVVKPLGEHIAHCREYAGATILGDGSVALILDVAGICSSAKLSAAQRAIRDVEARRQSAAMNHDAQSYLVIENAPREYFGIPLALVSRIERIASDETLLIAGKRTISRDGVLLPLLAIEDLVKVTPRPSAKGAALAICRVADREIGFVAASIVDIMHGTTPIDGQTHVQPGIMGSTVIDGTLVLLLDVFGMVRSLLPHFHREPEPSRPEAPTEERVVLLVEDSPFFRKQVAACLVEDGIRVIQAEDGEQGIERLGEHEDILLIVTDVEMPRCDGLEMTRRIRSDRRYADMPIIALTSVSGEAAEQRGREAGVNEYLVKLDREQLVHRVNHHLSRAPRARSTVSGRGQSS